MATMSDTLGLRIQGGKRSYHQQSNEVRRDEFEAQQLIHQLVFGSIGLADTLGPTWQMVHDPRFIQIENSFIRFRQGRFGGDATTGQSKQLPDGSFQTSVEDLNQYSEILGEGRYFHSVLRSMAYYEAIVELWPQRRFSLPPGETLPGAVIFNRLKPKQQLRVLKLASTYSEYQPHNLATQPDEDIWNLIKQECPNYFNRAGKANPTAHQLFAILRLDLVGLIDDYAEVARLQEWVLLDDEHTLAEQQHIDVNAPRVWAEVEMLERALTLRASLRATAAQVLDQTGLSSQPAAMEITLTDLERDELLQIVYTSHYPDDQPQLITDVTQYLAAIQHSGRTTAEREADQCAVASQRAKKYVAQLKSGEALPINRGTDPGEDKHLSEEEKIADEIFHHPLKQMLFLRWTGAEEAAAHALTRDEKERYNRIADLLAPVFQSADYPVTEESAHELLMKAEALVPTRRLSVVEKTAEEAAASVS